MDEITSVQIGPIDVPISIALLDERTMGEYHHSPSPVIKINHKSSGIVKDMTIFHEVLEAITELYGLNFSERDIRTLEMSLCQFVKDNPYEVRQWVERVLTTV